jgi:Ulp1 family protease
MNDIKKIVSNMSADEQFEILQCIEKNYFIPVIMGKEYLATLLRRTEITADDLKSLQDNVVLNDEIIECAHEKIQELSGIDSSDDEYEEEIDDSSANQSSSEDN